jgi:hypothetical protein
MFGFVLLRHATRRSAADNVAHRSSLILAPFISQGSALGLSLKPDSMIWQEGFSGSWKTFPTLSAIHENILARQTFNQGLYGG